MANKTFPAPGPGKENSYLTNTKYGYDMVVGISEEAINSQLANYLDWYDGPEVIQWYQQKDENSPYELMEPIDLGGFNIFDIPTNGDIPEPLIADGCNFVAAIKAKLGWSADSTDESPDVIDLDRGIKAVTFKMFFSEFQMVSLKFGRKGPSWFNESQNPEQPYEFDYVVNLDFGSAEFGHLTLEQQQQLRNLNPSSAWSVQQLYLDLTTASLLSSPSFDSGEMGTLIKNFINSSAWKKFTDGGRLVLAHTVKKINADPINTPSMVPTNIMLGISSFIEADGDHDNKSPLTTLNYLMMTDQDAMPGQFGGFGWNWVQPDDRSNFNGCMAINRNKFVRFMKDMICGTGSSTGPINEICFLPDTYISWGKVSIDEHWERLNPNNSHIPMTEYSSGETVLSLSYVKDHEDTSERLWTAEAVNYLKYTLNFNVKFVANEIQMFISSEVYAKYKTDLSDFGTSKGVIGGYTLNPVYVIDVGPQGSLFAKLKEGTDSLTPVEHTRDEGWFAGIDGTSSVIDNEERGFDNFVRDHMQAFATDITNFLKNSGQLFIFPGGKTFTFKNPTFSKNQDLIAELTYNQV